MSTNGSSATASGYVMAGFESQVAARGGLAAIERAARRSHVTLAGGALARRDTEGAIRVDPLAGLPMPGHVLHVLDALVDGAHEGGGLEAGTTALVVSLAAADQEAFLRLTDEAELGGEGALWVTLVPAE